MNKDINWNKTFVKSEKVNHEKISYKNRYGISISADLYTPKDMDNKKYPALIIGTPYGGVKEQGAGVYAQTMAERGYIAIAFDESYNGESGGETRRISSPDVFTEDFSAGVDYLGTLGYVDREKIGAIGLCGSGAFAITAAQTDTRIKAIVTASMVDMSLVLRNEGMPVEQKKELLNQIGQQRWKDFESGKPQLTPEYPSKPLTELPKGLDPMTSEFYEYYAMERGHHPNSIGAFTVTSAMSFMNFPLMNYIETISPRPILFIAGENAFSKFFSEIAYNKAGEAKELYVVKGARHIDLYDRKDLIPFDKIELFFKENLK